MVLNFFSIIVPSSRGFSWSIIKSLIYGSVLFGSSSSIEGSNEYKLLMFTTNTSLCVVATWVGMYYLQFVLRLWMVYVRWALASFLILWVFLSYGVAKQGILRRIILWHSTNHIVLYIFVGFTKVTSQPLHAPCEYSLENFWLVVFCWFCQR